MDKRRTISEQTLRKIVEEAYCCGFVSGREGQKEGSLVHHLKSGFNHLETVLNKHKRTYEKERV